MSIRVYAAPLVGDAPNTLQEIETVVRSVLGAVTGIAGIAVFVMFVTGAFQFLTAGSNKESVQKAQQTFTFAAMGAGALILVWFAFVFLKDFTGLDLLKFSICLPGSSLNDPFCGVQPQP